MARESKLVSLADHRRAGPSIRRAKAAAGLVCFLGAALIGLSHGTPFAQTLERALVVGIGGNLAAWSASVVVWKRLLIAEAAGAAARRRERVAADGDVDGS